MGTSVYFRLVFAWFTDWSKLTDAFHPHTLDKYGDTIVSVNAEKDQTLVGKLKPLNPLRNRFSQTYLTNRYGVGGRSFFSLQSAAACIEAKPQ